MSLDAPGSRVNVMIRLIGLVFLGIGVTLAYFTYLGAVQASIVPQILPVFYLGAALLMIVGFIAVVANYKS